MVRQKWARVCCCFFLCTISVSASLNLAEPVYGASSSKSVKSSVKTDKKVKPSNSLKPTKIAEGPAGISADAAVLMDVATGDVLYGKQANKRRPPASTTKIMTAVLGLELGRSDEVVTVSQKAASIGEATLHLDPGEKITLYELITGALVRSGNDACVAIAEHISGSEDQFVQLMNKKAQALGAENTHFENTNGLPCKDHYSTAYDLALMARHGLQIPQFASIIRQKEAKIHFLEPNVFMDLKNTNKLLWNYPYSDGVKTGTTNAAGKCLVASATKGGRQLLAVVLNAPDRFGDAKKLLEWGFENTESVRIAGAGEVVAEFPSTKKPVPVFIREPIDLSLRKIDRKKLQTRVVWEKSANSSIRAGEQVGRFEMWLADRKLYSAPLFSENDVDINRSLMRLFSYETGKRE